MNAAVKDGVSKELSQVARLESILTRHESTRSQLLTAAIHGILNGRTADE